jgi:hypothetical protein
MKASEELAKYKAEKIEEAKKKQELILEETKKA